MGSSCAALDCRGLRAGLEEHSLEQECGPAGWPTLTLLGNSWRADGSSASSAPPPGQVLRGPLTRYFEDDYIHGRLFAGEEYGQRQDLEGDEDSPDVLENAKTGIKAWEHALDLRASAPHSPFLVLYHYTSRSEFLNLADGKRRIAEVFAGLADRRRAFGNGMRATAKEPEAFSSQSAALLHTNWPCRPGDPEVGDPAHETHLLQRGNPTGGPEDAKNAAVCAAILGDIQEAGLATYCLPILVPKEFAYSIWQRATPDLLGKVGLGCNRWGERQYEGRDVWVVQLTRDGEGNLNTVGAQARLKILQERLTRLKQEVGDADGDTVTATNQLASLLQDLGRPADAAPFLRQVVAAQESYLGADHLDSLAATARLAALLTKGGESAEALPLWKRVLAGYTKQLGSSHLSTISAAISLAPLLVDTDSQQEALALARKTLQTCQAKLEPKHPATLRASETLARLLMECGGEARRAEAEPLSWAAYEGQKELLGPRHPRTLANANDLAGILIASGKYAEAKPLCKRTMAGCEAALGATDPETLRSACNLALTLKATGKLSEAEPLFRLAYAGSKEAFGPKHDRTLAAAESLAGLLKDMGKASEAEPLGRRALAHYEETLGSSHRTTIAAVQSLAETLMECDKVDEAEALFRRALAGFTAKLGAKDAATLTCAAFLASLLESTARLAEAELFYRRALIGFEETLGPSHNYTLAAADSLASLLEVMGKRSEAKQLHRFIRDMAAEAAAKSGRPERPDSKDTKQPPPAS